MIDREEARTAILLTVAVIALMLVASFGFQSLAGNPLAPELTVEMRDAPATVSSDATGDTELFVIEHVGGRTLRMGELRIIVGSRASGIVFDRSNGWSRDLTGVSVEARLNGEAVDPEGTFGPGDAIAIVITRGTLSTADPEPVVVRVEHVPTKTVIARDTVEFA